MTHRSSTLNVTKPTKTVPAIDWGKVPSPEEWLKTQTSSESWKEFFDKNGFLVVRDILGPEEVQLYSDLYNKMLSGDIDTSYHRHDLGNHEKKNTAVENICQIMWPSVYVDQLSQGPLHQRACLVSRLVLGDDMAFDFDFLISKAPHTDTPTPWHQDQSYWPDMPDKRAVSCWCALDDVDVDNGCMWFVPGSHTVALREHRAVAEGVHVRQCDGSEEEGCPQPLKAGSVTLHHGKTIHYTRGNTTNRNRRAFVTSFRPQSMVDYERERGVDHGKEVGVHEILLKGQAFEDNS